MYLLCVCPKKYLKTKKILHNIQKYYTFVGNSLNMKTTALDKKTSDNTLLQPQLPLIISLFEKHKIKDAYLFGSALTENFDEKSDVDFLVSFDGDLDPLEKGELLWSLRFALEDDLNRPIDLITETSLKNPYFIEELNNTKQKIYG